MRRVLLVTMVATAAALFAPPTLAAQRPRDRLPGDRLPPDRAQLEQRFKQRLASVVQKQLGLTDDQTRRLADVNQKYETKRMDLLRRDRETRVAIRKELDDSTAANEDHVNQLLQEWRRIDRERFELVDSEQADLAKFLSPSQRARYLGIQEQVRRRVEAFRDNPQFMGDPGRGAGSGRGPGMNPRMNRRPPPPA
jgi:Spy/CpxP family protein refolding chaperone